MTIGLPSDVLNPVGMQSTPRLPLARRRSSLEGTKVLLIDNHKAGADTILEFMKEILSKRGVAEFRYVKLENSAIPIPEDTLKTASECAGALIALGD